jgi:hypothetical protein
MESRPSREHANAVHRAKGDRWSDDREGEVREMRNAETILGVIRDTQSRDRSLASLVRSKDSRGVLRGAVGKVPVRQLVGSLPYCLPGLGGGSMKPTDRETSKAHRFYPHRPRLLCWDLAHEPPSSLNRGSGVKSCWRTPARLHHPEYPEVCAAHPRSRLPGILLPWGSARAPPLGVAPVFNHRPLSGIFMLAAEGPQDVPSALEFEPCSSSRIG